MLVSILKSAITFFKAKSNHINSGGAKLHWVRCEVCQ